MRWRVSGRGYFGEDVLVRLQHHVDRDIAVGVDRNAEVVAVRVLDRLVDLLLRHGQDAVVVGADIGRAHAHRPLRRRAVGAVLDAADAHPLVAEAVVDAGGLESGKRGLAAHEETGAMAQLAVGARVLVGEDAVAIGAGVVDRGETRRGQQLRDVPHAVSAALALLLGVNVSRVPTLLKTLRASSATRPVSSPVSSRKNRP